MHRMLGHVDENYHCKPGFHLVFLGDYTDRGANDIEVLTLLLTLRMLNPTSVHLIRGNHEEVATQANYSNESQWFIAHENELTSLYKSLPLGVCIGVPVPGAKPPYVYCTHGAFSPAEDLNPLYESEHSSMVMKEIPVMQERIYEGREPKLEEKQRKAFQELQKVPVLTSHARWSDIGEQSGPSPRGKGWVFTPEHIRAWGRYNNIRFLIRAHQHEFKEFLVTRQGKRAGEEKVIAMTLPVGTTGGGYASLLREPRQGVLWQVATRVADWKKELALSVGEKQNVSFVLQGKKCGVYEKFPAPFVEQRPEEYRQYPPSFEQIDVTSIQMEEG